MSEFNDNMVEAMEDAMGEMGQDIVVANKGTILGIQDEAEKSYGAGLPGGGMQTTATIQVHVQKTEFDRIGIADNDRVEIPSLDLKGRIQAIKPYDAASMTLVIGNLNQRRAG